ncbi:DUF3920 family protein [Metabacillus iocasae]|uniref:DUF3920 family protein n=1 Tax=Priestia iocasae TaxID=2291674 RepID=A0ABS2R0I9_9BACI|nr:DUF3920 family protein [Metabacillus iocasae]MBM7704254.1 hypothetical protein [Metabacillus iocasae]
MNIKDILTRRTIYQQTDNWYVVDKEFAWNLSRLKEDVFQYMDQDIRIPVVFCDSCEANKIVSELGEEEAEYLSYASGIYWREVGIIFIFRFDDYLPLLETIFHELRHVMQEDIPELRARFELDKYLPYEQRLIEKDAFQFAKEKLLQYKYHHYQMAQ